MESGALKDINLTIKDRSFTMLVGHTGSGKSTLVQQINALLIPSEGQVDVNGIVVDKNVKKMKNIKELRKGVGLVFQFPEYQLFEETVLKDVSFGPKNFGVKKDEAEKLAKEALSLVGIDESLFDKSPFELSGGQKRRVAIAGVITLNPKILVLDEPTAGLDPQGSREMMRLFEKIHRRETTIVMITHGYGQRDPICGRSRRPVERKSRQRSQALRTLFRRKPFCRSLDRRTLGHHDGKEVEPRGISSSFGKDQGYRHVGRRNRKGEILI